MSMPVAYRPPLEDDTPTQRGPWSHAERRSADPVNQLGHELNRLCSEATDRYEIVAHLEALGYNTPRMLERCGTHDHFELAEALFGRVPRSRLWHPATRRERFDWRESVALTLALAVTFVLGTYASGAALVLAVAVLTWSQIAATLVSRAEAELPAALRPRVVALALWLGVVTLSASGALIAADLATLAPPMLWLSLAGLLWSGRRRAALALPLAITAAYLTASLAAGPLAVSLPAATVSQVVATVGGALGTLVVLAQGPVGVLRWALSRWRVTLLPSCYGLGQGALLIAGLRAAPAGAEVLPGAILLAFILLVSRAALVRFERALTDTLWREHDAKAFATTARRSLLAYLGPFVLPLVPIAALALPVAEGGGVTAATSMSPALAEVPWLYFWMVFTLIGVTLALGVALLALGNARTPALAVLAAGSLALVAPTVPFVVIASALIAVLGLAAARWLGRVDRYAVHLLQ